MNALVVGGNSGIGLSFVTKLLDKCEIIYCIGKEEIDFSNIDKKTSKIIEKKVLFRKVNFVNEDYSCLEGINDIDILIITIGFGRVAAFENLEQSEINNLIKVNLKAPINIIKHYYDRIKRNNPFYTVVMGSIAGHIVSPLFSIYGSTKSGLCSFIENINAELTAVGFKNRVLDVSPGVIQGTGFYGKPTQLDQINVLTEQVLDKMFKSESLFIPNYDETYAGIIRKYQNDPISFGVESYHYKEKRITEKKQIVIGYLSGTFDLFHIGHLNLLRRAKEQCDYLIVGVHESGSWKGKETFIPFNERLEIIKSCKYVDLAIKSFSEDMDAWDVYHYNKLFVGSDYKGSERFLRYEEYFKDKDVNIVYFPYTQGTSSTQLREKLKKN